MTDADIEAVARAIFAADMPPGTNPDAQYPKGFDSPYETVSAWSLYEKAALFAIMAYEDSLAQRGIVVVPREATQEMTGAILKPTENRTEVCRIYSALIESAITGDAPK